jgi:hypothetical protein
MDLYKNKYDLETLKRNIYFFNLIDILKTQHLTPRFVVHYVLNNHYQLTKEEEQITIEKVLFFQPHIKLEEIINEQIIYDSDCESIPDFEICSCSDENKYNK